MLSEQHSVLNNHADLTRHRSAVQVFEIAAVIVNFAGHRAFQTQCELDQRAIAGTGLSHIRDACSPTPKFMVLPKWTFRPLSPARKIQGLAGVAP